MIMPWGKHLFQKAHKLEKDNERLRAALEYVQESGILHGSTELSDKVSTEIGKALERNSDDV